MLCIRKCFSELSKLKILFKAQTVSTHTLYDGNLREEHICSHVCFVTPGSLQSSTQVQTGRCSGLF